MWLLGCSKWLFTGSSEKLPLQIHFIFWSLYGPCDYGFLSVLPTCKNHKFKWFEKEYLRLGVLKKIWEIVIALTRTTNDTIYYPQQWTRNPSFITHNSQSISTVSVAFGCLQSLFPPLEVYTWEPSLYRILNTLKRNLPLEIFLWIVTLHDEMGSETWDEVHQMKYKDRERESQRVWKREKECVWL